MAITINENPVSLHIGDADVTVAVRFGDPWGVTGWPRLLTRNDASTALWRAGRLLAGHGDDDPFVACVRSWAMADRLIRLTTAVAVAAVAAVAAVISYRHAYELVRSHGESGLTARLVPFTVDGLIWAASMLILDANRRNRPVPPLAQWCLGAGIIATNGANLAHGLGHGPIGALVSAWPALALVGSFELLATLIRAERRGSVGHSPDVTTRRPAPLAEHGAPWAATEAPSLEQTVRAWHNAGRSQRAIAQELKIDRRKVKRIIADTA